MQEIIKFLSHLISTGFLCYPFRLPQYLLNSYYAPCSVLVLRDNSPAIEVLVQTLLTHEWQVET